MVEVNGCFIPLTHPLTHSLTHPPTLPPTHPQQKLLALSVLNQEEKCKQCNTQTRLVSSCLARESLPQAAKLYWRMGAESMPSSNPAIMSSETVPVSDVLPLGSAIHWAFQKFSETTKLPTMGVLHSKPAPVLLYKQFSEPNNCGFGRMSAMNTDMSHEYFFINSLSCASHVLMQQMWQTRLILNCLARMRGESDGFPMLVKSSTSKRAIKRQLYSGPFTLREAGSFIFRHWW